MAELGLGQKPVIMPHYPHMMSEDIAVWTEYLQDPVAPIKQVWYDVHVGRGMEVTKNAGTLELSVASGVSRKRIDVVCQVGGGYWVVEVKPFGSYLAMGQVLNYARLFAAGYEVDGEIVPVIICAAVDPDILDDIEALGVAVIKV